MNALNSDPQNYATQTRPPDTYNKSLVEIQTRAQLQAAIELTSLCYLSAALDIYHNLKEQADHFNAIGNDEACDLIYDLLIDTAIHFLREEDAFDDNKRAAHAIFRALTSSEMPFENMNNKACYLVYDQLIDTAVDFLREADINSDNKRVAHAIFRALTSSKMLFEDINEAALNEMKECGDYSLAQRIYTALFELADYLRDEGVNGAHSEIYDLLFETATDYLQEPSEFEGHKIAQTLIRALSSSETLLEELNDAAKEAIHSLDFAFAKAVYMNIVELAYHFKATGNKEEYERICFQLIDTAIEFQVADIKGNGMTAADIIFNLLGYTITDAQHIQKHVDLFKNVKYPAILMEISNLVDVFKLDDLKESYGKVLSNKAAAIYKRQQAQAALTVIKENYSFFNTSQKTKNKFILLCLEQHNGFLPILKEYLDAFNAVLREDERQFSTPVLGKNKQKNMTIHQQWVSGYFERALSNSEKLAQFLIENRNHAAIELWNSRQEWAT